MSGLAKQAADILIAKSVFTLSGTWPVKVGRLLEAPHAMAAIYDTPGQTPNPKYLLDFPTIMVMVRGDPDDYDGAQTKMKAVKDALLGIDPQVISGEGRWDGVTALGDINFLRYDQNSRPLWTGNYRIIYEPVSNALTSREPL